MIGRIFSFAMAVLLCVAAQAGAQTREVEVFYDRYGREVLVDVYTGEVVGVLEPDGSIVRRGFEEPRRDGGYRSDRPDEDGWSRRERRMEQLGRQPYRERLPEYRDYRAAPEPDYRDDYEYGYDYDDDYARREPLYEEPRYEQPGYETGSLPENERVERSPLESPSVAVIPDASSGQPETIIDQAPGNAVPDVTRPPQIGLDGATEDVAKIQILLDRAGASPGVIDGRMGDNVNKAIAAWRDMKGEALRTYDAAYVDAQLAATGGDAFVNYEITPVDVAGPFVASIPSDYGEKARLERMSFTSVAEMLAERFHMDERYLRALNPGANFDRPGTFIKVANVQRAQAGKVMRIIADKSRRQVRAYDEAGTLLAVYPSTIGSAATPSPTGIHTVERIALDPEYTYNPRINFQQGDNTRVLTIPPGPNGPVGTVWIGLSKPTYGIHGTPDPSKIGKTESNGCIRLTNWDAQQLAKMVQVGATVEFVE